MGDVKSVVTLYVEAQVTMKQCFIQYSKHLNTRHLKSEIIRKPPVVYFNQRIGAPFAIQGLTSLVSALKQIFSSFSVTNQEKGKIDMKIQEITRKTCI